MQRNKKTDTTTAGEYLAAILAQMALVEICTTAPDNVGFFDIAAQVAYVQQAATLAAELFDAARPEQNPHKIHKAQIAEFLHILNPLLD